MIDEKETLRRIIEDVVEAELRYSRTIVGSVRAIIIDQRDLAHRIAREVLQRLDRERIQVTSST